MVIGEPETECRLDLSELRLGQTWPDLDRAGQRQTTRRFLTKANRVLLQHKNTVSGESADVRQRSRAEKVLDPHAHRPIHLERTHLVASHPADFNGFAARRRLPADRPPSEHQ